MDFKELLDTVFQKTVDTVADLSVEAAKTASTTAQKTMEYINENRLMPGAKDQYIKELEMTIKEKDREIQLLKRRLAKKTWKNRK